MIPNRQFFFCWWRGVGSLRHDIGGFRGRGFSQQDGIGADPVKLSKLDNVLDVRV